MTPRDEAEQDNRMTLHEQAVLLVDYARKALFADDDLIVEIESALRAAEQRGREALRNYVQHGDGCAAWPEFTGYFHQASNSGACTYGLDAALDEPASGASQPPQEQK